MSIKKITDGDFKENRMKEKKKMWPLTNLLRIIAELKIFVNHYICLSTSSQGLSGLDR